MRDRGVEKGTVRMISPGRGGSDRMTGIRRIKSSDQQRWNSDTEAEQKDTQAHQLACRVVQRAILAGLLGDSARVDAASGASTGARLGRRP